MVQYVDATPKNRSSDSAKRVSGARVLTSAQCVAILKEKEEQKKKEKEEKERRKLERESKKHEREEALKKRAEERAMKAEERKKKAAELAKKREMRTSRKRTAATPSTNQRKKSNTSSKTPESHTGAAGSSSSNDKPAATTSVSDEIWRSNSSSTEIDTNECCICFRTFEEDTMEKTGLDWVECVCGRWLHEECITYNIISDASGRELLCPFCCV